MEAISAVTLKPANHKKEPQGSPQASERQAPSGRHHFASATEIQSPAVFQTESEAISWIKKRIATGTIVHADEASGWNALHGRYEVKRINHQMAYSADGFMHQLGGRVSFRGCAEPSLAIITTSPVRTCFVMRRKPSWREDNRRVVEWRPSRPA